MPLDAATFEKLGAFYLGREINADTGERTDVPLLYDSADLTTHAVCVGMTGSGKTGLGVALLEEAAIDGIPALIIDPKGDLTNLALQFPDLSPEEFRPWMPENAAASDAGDVDTAAKKQSELWRSGLANWGQDAARIQRLRDAADVVVFTPGSTAGQPVSVIQSFAPPGSETLQDPELLAAELEAPVAGLLGLLGVDSGARSREATLISTLLRHAWMQGKPLSLIDLARQIQSPPMATIGVLDVDSFFPEKDRFQLVLALNNLLASPGFETWLQGVPLDVQSLLYSSSGKPRLAVFCIAHLSDAERMFFVTMLLGATVAWMRKQSGTTSLRALLYMDEIFGYFPPTANPPSKTPLMTLLKQARAFGLGVVLATQNPADLDYKGLSNAGTWFIGRLQAERDKLRLLDGLAGMGLDRGRIDRMLSGLGKRVFLMNNVHENAPVLFESRWALSYLCGPLTREQIRRLPQTQSETFPLSAAATSKSPEPPVESPALAPIEDSTAPVLPKIRQIYPKDAESGILAPVLAALATVRFRDAKAKVDCTRDLLVSVEFTSQLTGPDWSAAEPMDPENFGDVPPNQARWLEIPESARRPAAYEEWKRSFAAWIAQGCSLDVMSCGDFMSEPNESEGAFRIRIRQQLHELRDARVAELRQMVAKKAVLLENRIRSATDAVRIQEAQAGQARIHTAMTIGQTLIGAFLGRRKLGSAVLTRAGTAVRGVGRSAKEADDVAVAREKLQAAEREMADLQADLEAQISEITRTLDPYTAEITSKKVAASKTGSRVQWVGIAWIRVS